MKRLALLVAGALLLSVTNLVPMTSALADTKTINFENPPYVTVGSIDTQDGWAGSGGAPIDTRIDQAVVAHTTDVPTGFGDQSFRMSNAYTDGGFGNWPFSPSLTNEAGETSAISDGFSGGTRQPGFQASFDVASAVPNAEQHGLQISISPDRGDGARMSFLRLRDAANGLALDFIDYQSGLNETGCATGANFVKTTVATGLNRSVPHSIKLTMGFLDGAANDVVKVYVDGTLVHTGTSWEDYYLECESNPTRTVDSLIFQARTQSGDVSDTWAANAENGFLFDNLSYSSSPIADLSVSQTLPSSVLASASNDPTETRALTFSVTVSNLGPNTATDVALTNTFDATRVDPTSAMYCVESSGACTPSTPYTGEIDLVDPIAFGGSQVVDFQVNMLGSPYPLHGGPLDHTGLPSNAHQALANAVSVTSAAVDPVSSNNSAGDQVTVITAPDPVDDATYDVQPGNTNAVVSWAPPAVNGGETVDFYRLTVTASPGGSAGQGTFDIYPPTPTPPVGARVATSCAGRLGGTLCYNLTGLTNSTATPPAVNVTYTVVIRAHNAVGLSDGRTRTASPSASNLALIVPPTTAQTFSTCGAATTKTPICIVYNIPSGGGGAFSTQAITDAYAQCIALGGTTGDCGALAALGSFEGHPPVGYTVNNPLMIQITWDVTVAGNLGVSTPVYYQRDGFAPKLVRACTKSGAARPDPCLKAIKILGKNNSPKTCKPQSSCSGDIQAQILLSSSPNDAGIYHR